MGQEFAQEREWSEERELDWFLLSEDLNKGMQNYMKELLKIYRKYPCMYENDNNWFGFEWMNCDDKERSTYSFIRKSENGKNNLLFVINMTPMKWEDYVVGVPKKKKYKLLLNSDEKQFGGSGVQMPKELNAKKENCNGKEYSITMDLPPFSALIFQF